jgi:hypothetical protein
VNVRFRHGFELTNASPLIPKFGFMRLAPKLASLGGIKMGHAMAQSHGAL